MGLCILTVAWMQNECLFSIVSEHWTHIFKFRKSEKPCMDYRAKKLSEKLPQSMLKHVWTLLGSILGIFGILNFFWFFFTISKARPAMEHGAFFLKKIATKHVQNKFGQFWERSSAFLQFWFFLIFSKTSDDSMEQWSKKTFPKTLPQDRFGHLGTIWDISRNLKLYWFFSWIFSKYLPQNISPENWIQIF